MSEHARLKALSGTEPAGLLQVSADVDLGFMRWLTIALPAQPDRQIMLEVPGAPFVDEETAAGVARDVSPDWIRPFLVP